MRSNGTCEGRASTAAHRASAPNPLLTYAQSAARRRALEGENVHHATAPWESFVHLWPTMRLWPRREKRSEASSPTPDAVIAALLAHQAAALPTGATGALEAAAALYSRALSLAEVSPSTPTTRLLTPAVLAEMARGLIVAGESLHVVAAEEGGAWLQQAGAWEVLGRSPRPSRWRYRVDVATPETTLTRTYAADDVAHCRYATRPGVPWKGVSPMGGAPTTERLIGKVETALVKEFQVPSALVVFTGGDTATLVTPDKLESGYAELGRSLRDSADSDKGGIVLGTTHRATGDAAELAPDPFGLPNASPVSERLGPMPPREMHELRSKIEDSVLAACGVPPALVRAESAGAAREALRQWLHVGIAHIAGIIREEAAAKLGVPALAFAFDRLHAADITGRARAFGSMVQAGMDAGRAATLAGLHDAK